MRSGLLDTSVFVALESGRSMLTPDLPSHSAVSVVTSAELRAGVLAAKDPMTRWLRLATFTKAARLEPIPVDESVAAAWAQLRLGLRERRRAMQVNDSWIAATAIAHELVLVTQDRGFVDVPGLEVVLV